MTKKIIYEERVCFFIDILGFKGIVQGQKKKSAQKISEILNLIKSPLSFFQHQQQIFETKQITHFSDSVVISFKYKESDEIYLILNSILALQVHLLKEYNILLRGACTIGKLFHNKDMIFGEALNKAYELESKCSIFPRIIMLNDTIKKCAEFSNISDKAGNIKRDFLKKDSDGYWYINYLMTQNKYPQYCYNNEAFDTLNDYEEYLNKIKDTIDNNINSSNLSINQKYLWLKEKYNEVIKEVVSND